MYHVMQINITDCVSPRRPGLVVVDESHVVRPAVDDGGDELLDVEPEVEPVGLLGAEVVHGGALVQPGLDLTAAVAGDEDDGVEVPAAAKVDDPQEEKDDRLPQNHFYGEFMEFPRMALLLISAVISTKLVRKSVV